MEEGAFTGAKKGGKKGFFEDAAGGTVFLDEISELPTRMQSKLLRVLQENKFSRIGGNKIISLNVRIIASSNLSRDQLSDESILRRDLFYRLNVIPIYIPALRERKEDIFPLIHFFLKSINAKYDRDIRISKSLMVRLHNYDWPGNVRELKNIVERLIVMADSNEVSNHEYELLNQMEVHYRNEEGISIEKVIPLKSAFQKLEQILIKRASEKCGTIIGAAKMSRN